MFFTFHCTVLLLLKSNMMLAFEKDTFACSPRLHRLPVSKPGNSNFNLASQKAWLAILRENSSLNLPNGDFGRQYLLYLRDAALPIWIRTGPEV